MNVHLTEIKTATVELAARNGDTIPAFDPSDVESGEWWARDDGHIDSEIGTLDMQLYGLAAWTDGSECQIIVRYNSTLDEFVIEVVDLGTTQQLAAVDDADEVAAAVEDLMEGAPGGGF